MLPIITFDELLNAMRDADKGEGFTVSELADAQQMSVDRARAIVKTGLSKQMIRPSRKVITDMSGRTLRVPSYVFIEKGAK